jgi:hypothetical protein
MTWLGRTLRHGRDRRIDLSADHLYTNQFTFFSSFSLFHSTRLLLGHSRALPAPSSAGEAAGALLRPPTPYVAGALNRPPTLLGLALVTDHRARIGERGSGSTLAWRGHGEPRPWQVTARERGRDGETWRGRGAAMLSQANDEGGE